MHSLPGAPLSGSCIVTRTLFAILEPRFSSEPMLWESQGATRTVKTTGLLTGFPGRPKIGVPLQEPNRGGPPGLIIILQKLICPSSSIICLTRSHLPILTPPLVIIASQVSAASSRASLKSSMLSRIRSYLSGMQPIFLTSEDIPNVLDS